MGASPEQKMTAALRMLGSGISADGQDEYCRIAESTVMKSFHAFCKTVVEIYGKVYLRAPTADDVRKILRFNESRGMPGLLGSLDCTHWRWKNCPTAWHGHYRGKEGAPTVVLEAIATADRWIWHAFFGIPGSNNDLNILDRSPLLHSFLNDSQPRVQYEIDGVNYDTPYYFVDGIYPAWSTFISAYTEPEERSKKAFTTAHEAIRKDVECAFGILKSRFGVLAVPSRLWYEDQMKYVIYCCVILHNMVIELRGENVPDYLPDPYGTENLNPTAKQQPLEPVHVSAAADECLAGSIMEICKRLKVLHDKSASLAMREVKASQ
ncbi:hypothetical protein F442_18106 [Phytophthora nicotianae P10297]|uniref:DDE Tnp4 domain-containing protein n=1 Tax=Phytophthora nicotianae P10297 TaxID=1317064 RepID=W2YFE1_PHYNI|nr:hypothetical protein F442_18106 [Phytophthora nicotianae P10297]